MAEASQSEGLQERNRSWWERNAMNYDWQGTLKVPDGSREFYAEIDRRFFTSSPFYYRRGDDRPFADLIPFERLRGARVLEVGCGLGSHAQLLCEAGADLTAIDITERAVTQTRRRLELMGLRADVRQADAEHLPFEDNRFDFIWSWGVIHHSANTVAVLQEMQRVLKPGGEVRLMVYNLDSIEAWGKIVRGALTGKFFRGMSVLDVLTHYSDGYIARHYTGTSLSRLLVSSGFEEVSTRVLGQRSEMLPMPGVGPLSRLKQRALRLVPPHLTKAVLSRWGWFLFATARKARSGRPPSLGDVAPNA